MTGRRRRHPLRLAGGAIGVLGVLVAAALTGSSAGGQETPGDVVLQSDAALSTRATPFGATTNGGVAETWAWTVLAGDEHRPAGLDFAPVENGDARQLVLVRHTRTTGWRMEQTPRTIDGAPYKGIQPAQRGARVAPGGSAVLLGDELGQIDRAAVLARDPGGTFRRLPDPPATTLLPGERLTDVERTPVAVADVDGHAEVYAGALGPPVESAVLHWDGAAWAREPLCVTDRSQTPAIPPPAGCATDESLPTELAELRVLALSAGDSENVWLLAEPPEDSGLGVLLFRRTTAGGAARWVAQQGLPNGFGSREPGGGVTALGANGHRLAEPLTATADGVWVDGTFDWQGERRNFTFFLRESGELTSWCNGPAPLCDPTRPFDARFGTDSGPGHQSFAWAGPGFGQRIIVNPIPPGHDAPNGSYLELVQDGGAWRFARRPGGGQPGAGSAAFAAPDEGWLQGGVHVTRHPDPRRLAAWPLPVRRPLTAIAAEPGMSPGSLDARALAVGLDGTVVRYQAGVGWQPEFLLSSVGAVRRPDLRGVAWPTPRRAYAVGELGTIWRWRESLGLWEQDPGAPPNFDGELTGVAFQPGNPERGYAVGERGTLLSYGKGWDPEPLPETPAAKLSSEGRLGGPVDVRAIAFAGAQAIAVAGRHVIVNDGAGWHVDEGAEAKLSELGDGRVPLAVAGLPDGGAVVAGSSFVLARDVGGGPWRFTDQPLLGRVPVAVAAIREDGRVRAVVSAMREQYPAPNDVVEPPVPGFPAPPFAPTDPPFGGQVIRETASGWRDDQHEELDASFAQLQDLPPRGDPVLAFALDAAGEGWAVGGWTGAYYDTPSADDGATSARTAAAYRYGAQPTSGAGTEPASIPLSPGPTRFAVGGHAECVRACADYASLGLGPDRALTAAVRRAGVLAAQPNGPRAFLYTGGRVAPPDRANPEVGGSPASIEEEARLAQLLTPSPALPVFAVVGTGDSLAGQSGAFSAAFAGFPSPFGAPGGARTHYAFELGGVRVIVIDNSRGSLGASDPHQVPIEPGGQLAWLRDQLAIARQARTPALVMGHRDLNSRFNDDDQANMAADADAVAAVLRDGGASAYLYDRPEQARSSLIPAGGADRQLPEHGLGTLGYQGAPSDSRYGTSGLGLVEVDASKRDPDTNQAPVRLRLLPLVEELAIEAVDGTLLRRSQPALFRGLGRRPRGGRRIAFLPSGPTAADGSSYVELPAEPCALSAPCPGRLEPEHRFASSDPDIADFVRRDPASDNLRKPLLDPQTDKPIPDSTSNLLCAFNAGTTTVTLEAGGLRTAAPVTVQAGSVQRPCGTVPLNPSRFSPRPAPTRPSEQPEPPPPPPGPPAETPLPTFAPPALPPLLPLAMLPAPRPVRPPPPLLPAVLAAPLVAIFPPPPVSGRPIPPSTSAPVPVSSSVIQTAGAAQKEKEEEAAVETENAFSRYEPDADQRIPGGLIYAAVVVLALAGAGIRGAGRGGRRPIAVPARAANRSFDRRRIR